MEPQTPKPNSEQRMPPVSPVSPAISSLNAAEHVKPVRTLSSDMASAMRENQGAAVKAAIENEKRLKEEKEAQSPFSKRNMFFVVGGLLIILVSAGAAYYFVRERLAGPETVPVIETPIAKSLVPSDSTAVLNVAGLEREALGSRIHDFAVSQARAGYVTNVIVADGQIRIPVSRFLFLLRSHASVPFAEKLGQDFMIGSYQYQEAEVFLVMRGAARDYMEDGMRQWEPFLISDLAPLFGIDTQNATAPFLDEKFSDALIENRPSRAVLSEDGTPVLFYAFLDQNTVIVTNGQRSLAEAVRRFNQEAQ